MMEIIQCYQKFLSMTQKIPGNFPRVFSHTFQPPSADCSLFVLCDNWGNYVVLFFLSNCVSEVSNEAKNPSTANDVGLMWMIYNASSGPPYFLSHPTIKPQVNTRPTNIS